MKTGLFTFVLLVCGLAVATAQNPYISLLGATETSDGIVLSQPRTVLAVDITVEQETIASGPYARYAQKFLGVRAPLTDKASWVVTGASVALLDATQAFGAASVAESSRRVVEHAVSEDEFTRLQADKIDIEVLPLEEAARLATQTIFSLRKHRLELITGEAGENVFGEGLKAALDQIAAHEQAYLELFLGHCVLKRETKRYVVYPEADKMQYVACRFDPETGLLPASDLTGDMVVLQIEPSGRVDATVPVEASAKDTNTVDCRVADLSTCSVVAGGQEYTRVVLPLFEFGRTIRVPLPRRK